MTRPPAHVTEEDLILHFYGEAAEQAGVEAHLASCAACQEQLARLQRVLSLVDTSDALSPKEAPGPSFEREVWARLEPRLAAQRVSWWSALLHGRPAWVLAGGLAALLIVAFVAGRFSTDVVPSSTDTADSGLAERVLVVAVVDHLDRSQMVLLEVLNADIETTGDLAAQQTMARELVSSSRLYRQSAMQSGDDSTGDVLEELERALLEIANTPETATKEELDALRARIASRGLLFKVRVVGSEMRQRERQTVVPGSQS
jgi:hypothetical protein